MKKNILKGMLFGAVIVIVVIALGAIYDYCPSVAQIIWPNSVKFKEILIYEDLFDDKDPAGSIPPEYFNQIHVCEIWETADKEYVDPSMVSGIFIYDFDVDRWIYCQ